MPIIVEFGLCDLDVELIELILLRRPNGLYNIYMMMSGNSVGNSDSESDGNAVGNAVGKL